MTNVTKKKTTSKEFLTAKQELVRLLGRSSCAGGFIDEVLTDSEQIMLVKRFAAILMYQRGFSPYRVWNTLYISPSTAERIHTAYENGRYARIIKAVGPKTSSGFLSLIDDLIRAQASPQARARIMKRAGW